MARSFTIKQPMGIFETKTGVTEVDPENWTGG